MTASEVASLAIIAAPHLEMLLRCVFPDRVTQGRKFLWMRNITLTMSWSSMA
jgi:hypothetical protein